MKLKQLQEARYAGFSPDMEIPLNTSVTPAELAELASDLEGGDPPKEKFLEIFKTDPRTLKAMVNMVDSEVQQALYRLSEARYEGGVGLGDMISQEEWNIFLPHLYDDDE